jgi:hypothetical protein
MAAKGCAARDQGLRRSSRQIGGSIAPARHLSGTFGRSAGYRIPISYDVIAIEGVANKMRSMTDFTVRCSKPRSLPSRV